MSKSGVRKGKDFVKNMEKLKKIYGGKIPKSLSIDEADKVLKKVTPIKKKSEGEAREDYITNYVSKGKVKGGGSKKSGTVTYAEATATTDWQVLTVTFTPTTTYGLIQVYIDGYTDARRS